MLVTPHDVNEHQEILIEPIEIDFVPSGELAGPLVHLVSLDEIHHVLGGPGDRSVAHVALTAPQPAWGHLIHHARALLRAHGSPSSLDNIRLPQGSPKSPSPTMSLAPVKGPVNPPPSFFTLAKSAAFTELRCPLFIAYAEQLVRDRIAEV